MDVGTAFLAVILTESVGDKQAIRAWVEPGPIPPGDLGVYRDGEGRCCAAVRPPEGWEPLGPIAGWCEPSRRRAVPAVVTESAA